MSISARLFKVGVWPCPSLEAAGFRHVLVVASVLIFHHVISRQRIRSIALFRSMMRVRGRGLRGPPARTSLTAIARGGDTCSEPWTHSTDECKERRTCETRKSCHAVDALSSAWANIYGGVEGAAMLGGMELRDAAPPSHRRRLREGQASTVLARSWLLMNAPPLIYAKGLVRFGQPPLQFVFTSNLAHNTRLHHSSCLKASAP